MDELRPPAQLSETAFSQALILFLNELRVALTGAQLLVAFLLSLPFTAKFEKVDALDHHIYFLAFASALSAALLLIAPSVYHRMHLRRMGVHPDTMLLAFNRLAVSGALCLAVSMTAVSFLVTRFVYDRWVALLVSAVAAVAFGWFWFGLPKFHRAQAKAPPPS